MGSTKRISMIGLVLGISLLAVQGFAEEPPKGPLGYGIFLHLQYPAREKGIASSLMEHPLVDGARYSFNWAELEPTEGQYNWEPIEEVLSAWAEKGKRVIVAVKTAQKGGESPSGEHATPEWVFAAGAQKVIFVPKGSPAQGQPVVFPVYWDPIYLAQYERFVRAFAARFDGDPHIEYVEIGIGQGGATKVTGDRGGLEAFKAQPKPPYTPQLFVETCQKVIDIYDAAFQKTPVTLFLNTFFRQEDGTEKKEMPELARYAAQRGIYLFSRSLDDKVEAMVERGYAAVFHELGSKTKTAFAYDFNIIKDPSKKPGHPYEESLEAFRAYLRNALGGVAEEPGQGDSRPHRRRRKKPSGGMVPTTYLSYLLLLEREASLMDPHHSSLGPWAYDKRIEDAVREVREKLRETLP